MAVEQSVGDDLLARDTTLRVHVLTDPLPTYYVGAREEPGTYLNPLGSVTLSRMDKDSKDCLATGPLSRQTRSLSRQLTCSEISSADISTCNSASNQSTSSQNEVSGPFSKSPSSATIEQSQGLTVAHSSQSPRQRDDNSSFSPLGNQEGTQSFLLSKKIARKLSTMAEAAAANDVIKGTYGQPERTSSFVDNERHRWISLLNAPVLDPGDNVRCPNIDQLLFNWNDSPFVSSYPNQSQQLEVSSEEWSSQGSPWHIDLHKVVTGDMVATGSYGMIFKGIYKGEKVAVKLLLIPEASSKAELNKLKANFVQEVDLWYTLSHPNIVQFIGAYIVPPRSAIVTEFLHGGSLRAFLGRQQPRKLAHTTVRAMALDIARGMEYLHQNGIMHRDLKSGNLLLDEKGTVKVADFGLARFEAGDPGNLTAETGTIRWMAPEVICHMPYTRKIDVYSYGIVLWELCTSLIPFEGMSFVQLAHAVANDHHRPSTSDLPFCFVKLMRQCWDKDPSKRPDFAAIVKYLEADFVDGPKSPMKAGHKIMSCVHRTEPGAQGDHYSRPTLSMRGGRTLRRNQTSGPSFLVNADVAISDDEEWVTIRRQCRCTIV